MTSSNGNIFRVTGPLCGEFTGHRWIPRKGWSGALVFSLICAWINSWVNNRAAGDQRCHRAHYDVIVMNCSWRWDNLNKICTCVVHVWSQFSTTKRLHTSSEQGINFKINQLLNMRGWCTDFGTQLKNITVSKMITWCPKDASKEHHLDIHLPVFLINNDLFWVFNEQSIPG